VASLDRIGSGGFDATVSETSYCPKIVDRASEFYSLVHGWALQKGLHTLKSVVMEGRVLVHVTANPSINGFYEFTYDYDGQHHEAKVEWAVCDMNGVCRDPMEVPEANELNDRLFVTACYGGK
jgi:hypothetical protein